MTNDKQKDRLVELLEKASEECINIPCNGCKYVNERHCKARMFVDRILADGWMRPPCKVGDKVYWINHITKEIETDMVIAIHQYEDGLSIATNTTGRKSTTTFSLNRFLEIMSFTKEEAEAKLKEGVQG